MCIIDHLKQHKTGCLFHREKQCHYGHKADHVLEKTVLWRKLNIIHSVTDALLVKLEWISCASAPDLTVSTGFHWAEHGNLNFVTTSLKMIPTVTVIPYTVPVLRSPHLQRSCSCAIGVGSDVGKVNVSLWQQEGNYLKQWLKKVTG